MKPDGSTTTRRGRVVYDTPKHYFTENDLLRILKNFRPSNENLLIQIIHKIEDELFSIMAPRLTVREALKFARDWVERELAKLIDRFLLNLKVEITYKVPGEKPTSYNI